MTMYRYSDPSAAPLQMKARSLFIREKKGIRGCLFSHDSFVCHIERSEFVTDAEICFAVAKTAVCLKSCAIVIADLCIRCIQVRTL